MKTLKKTFILLAMMVTAITFLACGSKPTSSQNGTEDSSASTDGAALENTTWSYFTHKDDLTGDIISFNALLKSVEYKQIDHYDHSARMAILLTSQISRISHAPESSIMFSFTDDNDLCRLADTGSSGILVVFDNGEVDDTWSLIRMGPEKKSLGIDYIFSGPDKVLNFINKLKASKQCKIQVCLNTVGNTTFTFNTAGLEWDFKE